MPVYLGIFVALSLHARCFVFTRKNIKLRITIFAGTQIELFFGYDINLRAPVTGLRFWVYTLHQMLAE